MARRSVKPTGQGGPPPLGPLFERSPVAVEAPIAVLPNLPLDVDRQRIIALSASPGQKYCFSCDRFEYDVWMFLVGRRWVFLCRDTAAELGGKIWTGKHDKPTED